MITADYTAGIYSREIKIRRGERNVKNIINYNFDDYITTDSNVKEFIAKAHKVACFDSDVLIQGESGTGKEIIAQAIHRNSTRCEQPFVAVNFAAIQPTLLESELFGYEEGSFTGAKKAVKKVCLKRLIMELYFWMRLEMHH